MRLRPNIPKIRKGQRIAPRVDVNQNRLGSYGWSGVKQRFLGSFCRCSNGWSHGANLGVWMNRGVNGYRGCAVLLAADYDRLYKPGSYEAFRYLAEHYL
jgi:hypothetical protein